MNFNFFVLVLGLATIPITWAASSSRADDGDAAKGSAPHPTLESSTPRAREAKKYRRGTVVDSKSSTEGTRALNRFHTEVIKRSVYQIDGKPLEVDPD